MNETVVERARGLFEFLLRAQKQRTETSRVANINDYRRDGAVLWVSDMPQHPAVELAQPDTAAPDDPLLTVDRVAREDPPQPGAELEPWLAEPHDDPSRPPGLRETIGAPDESAVEGDVDQLTLDDHPHIRHGYERWAAQWQDWAVREVRDRPARQLYDALFSMFLKIRNSPEEMELVAGTALLSWALTDQAVVLRHLFVSPLAIDFDDKTGRLAIRPAGSPEPFKVELDMLDPGLLRATDNINEVRAQIRQLDVHPFAEDELNPLGRRLVHALDADGAYYDEDLPDPIGTARGSFSPALILRRRAQRGLVEVFEKIVEQLAAADTVPDGLIPLVDPDHVPAAEPARGPGAVVTVDEMPFLPMPVNDKQLQIIKAVDQKAQVLVQGPPGTGKTHTAAALISHLLAQGKRVLVTAQTDRALREVRDKLPAEVKPLAVAVVGTSREDMADLKVAVQTISARSHEHDPAENARVIEDCHTQIDRLRRERALVHHDVVALREREVRLEQHAGYRGTLAAIAERIRAEAPEFGWLLEFATVHSEIPPLQDTEIVEWRERLLDAALTADESEARMRLPELGPLPHPDVFANSVAAERVATANCARYEPLNRHPAFAAVLGLDPAQRQQLQRRLHTLADEAESLAGRREEWMESALRDVRSGRATVWLSRWQHIAGLIDESGLQVGLLGPLTNVTLSEADGGRLATLAREVRKYLDGGGKIKTTADGTPKLGAFAAKVLKQAQPLFDLARVDGLPPTSPAQLDAVVAWVGASRVLAALDKAWPEDVRIPDEDTLHERLQWHRTESEQLNRVLRLSAELEAEAQRLAQLQLPAPDWNDLHAIREYARLVDAAAAQETLSAATAPLARLANALAEAARWADTASATERLRASVVARDHDSYASAYTRLARLWEARGLAHRRDELEQRLTASAPRLAKAVSANPTDDVWTDRLRLFSRAWAWASTRAWVDGQESKNVNDLQAQIGRIEEQIRKHVEMLAARRAWDHAASPERLSGAARADLTQYAQLVQRGGKLTGKYATQQKAAIRTAMDNCRPSVPVWIMPLYRIGEQLRIQPNMFDVVIVDEASQAGVEATFLQYLAPRIVVIGDDKQVSPSAVGVDQQKLRDLAGQYIPHDRYRESWSDPKRSLFDEAKMRYGGLITLTEHRRCVPEIIGFSNRIAYQPEGIRLVPVRQYGADRLDPVKAVHLPDGYARGTTYKINPVEADAIVDQIEKCLADPAYAGRTFGVISLLGRAQANSIEQKLLERIGKQEWTARDLRCGDAPDFQGSERDVMFLSMVAAPEPGERLSALTHEMYVQRYNVAVSRAKDQVWVFHSVDRQVLHNREDMRFQLLDYCYGVIDRRESPETGATARLVPEDERTDPFDSLFEQRVYNRIVDRGYNVAPQIEAAGYRIDLVVTGGNARLAVECDGDHWHGPDQFEADLARQRDLERCGWQFFRIRESAFYVDQSAALAELWDALQDLEIYPGGQTSTPPAPVAGEPVETTTAEPLAPAAIEPAESQPDTVELDVDKNTESRREEPTPPEAARACPQSHMRVVMRSSQPW